MPLPNAAAAATLATLMAFSALAEILIGMLRAPLTSWPLNGSVGFIPNGFWEAGLLSTSNPIFDPPGINKNGIFGAANMYFLPSGAMYKT